MKVLSIQQPWAWLIINAGKDIENRGWSTRFRGRMLIHAGMRFDYQSWVWLRDNGWKIDERVMNMPEDHRRFKRGGIVGSVDVIDCVTESQSPWFSNTGGFGLVLANAREERFFEMKGRLSLFDVEWPPAATAAAADLGGLLL